MFFFATYFLILRLNIFFIFINKKTNADGIRFSSLCISPILTGNFMSLKKSLDTGLDSLKTASKKLVYKIDEFLGNKISEAVNSYDDKIVKTKPVEEIIIPPKKDKNY